MASKNVKMYDVITFYAMLLTFKTCQYFEMYIHQFFSQNVLFVYCYIRFYSHVLFSYIFLGIDVIVTISYVVPSPTICAGVASSIKIA